MGSSSVFEIVVVIEEPPEIQELRDLTRTRRQLTREIVQHVQRIQAVLIGNRLLLHISPYAEHAIYVYPPMVETERLTEKHRLRARN
jgi:hypothetical protein